jgi:membrane protein implicated in regulation of membrane protease activity
VSHCLDFDMFNIQLNLNDLADALRNNSFYTLIDGQSLLMANELKMPHVVVSSIYCAFQGVIAIGLILTELRYWFAFGVVVVLSIVYLIFMKKFFRLHLREL